MHLSNKEVKQILAILIKTKYEDVAPAIDGVIKELCEDLLEARLELEKIRKEYKC